MAVVSCGGAELSCDDGIMKPRGVAATPTGGCVFREHWHTQCMYQIFQARVCWLALWCHWSTLGSSYSIVLQWTYDFPPSLSVYFEKLLARMRQPVWGWIEEREHDVCHYDRICSCCNAWLLFPSPPAHNILSLDSLGEKPCHSHIVSIITFLHSVEPCSIWIIICYICK